MNDYIGRKVLGRDPEPGEQPNILQDYANTSSAGSIIAFAPAFGGYGRRPDGADLFLRGGIFRGLGDRGAAGSVSVVRGTLATMTGGRRGAFS